VATEVDEHLEQFEQVVTTVTRELQSNGGKVTSQIIQQTTKLDILSLKPHKSLWNLFSYLDLAHWPQSRHIFQVQNQALFFGSLKKEKESVLYV